MCLSAEASFGVGALLVPASVYCVRAALRKDVAYLPLAAVPLLFAAQQLAEGLVWVGIGRGDSLLVQRASLAFLYFALAFWPFWIPFCALFIERRFLQRSLLLIITLSSLLWCAVFYVPLLLETERYLTTQLVHHSIQYHYTDLPVYQYVPQNLLRLLYFATIAIPLLLCSVGTDKIFGALLGTSALLSQLIFWYAFVSVWCFFAAVLALYLCYAFYKLPIVVRETAMRGGVSLSSAR
jgi:hypothetical protein